MHKLCQKKSLGGLDSENEKEKQTLISNTSQKESTATSSDQEQTNFIKVIIGDEDVNLLQNLLDIRNKSIEDFNRYTSSQIPQDGL